MGETVAVRERPMRLYDHEVRAVLAGRQTQLRRAMKDQPVEVIGQGPANLVGRENCWMRKDLASEALGRLPFWTELRCPYAAGDRLWLQEPWACRGRHTDDCSDDEVASNPAHFSVFCRSACMDGSRERFNLDFLGRWRTAESLPRWASRITLEITEVRVQRLQEITLEDAIAEGLTPVVGPCGARFWSFGTGEFIDPVAAYWCLWNSINGKKKDCDSASIPYVWAISFRRLTPA